MNCCCLRFKESAIDDAGMSTQPHKAPLPLVVVSSDLCDNDIDNAAVITFNPRYRFHSQATANQSIYILGREIS